MVFSSIPFLYYFLPIVLLLYYLVPVGFQNYILLIFSLVFYAWGEPKYIFLMLATIILFYVFGLCLDKCKSLKKKKIILFLSVASGVLLLGVFKYADFFAENWNALTGSNLPLLRLALPIGISFYMFQCISYIADVYRGETPVQKSIVRFGAYVSMFPQLIAGPIVRYGSINEELSNRTVTLDDVQEGMTRFLIGLGKKVLLADNLGKLTAIYHSGSEKSVLFAWMYAIATSLQIYFDFSGYSDMAIGLGRMLGFHFCENFSYPYCAESITDFWRRWHMSLGSWFRDYVYIPMGGNRVSKLKWIRNIFVVWMLTGLWHGADWNFVIWGLFFAVLLLTEKLTKFTSRISAVWNHVYVMLAVMISFVIFQSSSLHQGWIDILSLFGFGKLPLFTGLSIYYLKSNLVLLLVSVIGATPFPVKIARKIADTKWGSAISAVFLIAILVLCTAYLVDESFHPFLYFRF